jgi:hypothetical protein
VLWWYGRFVVDVGAGMGNVLEMGRLICRRMEGWSWVFELVKGRLYSEIGGDVVVGGYCWSLLVGGAMRDCSFLWYGGWVGLELGYRRSLLYVCVVIHLVLYWSDRTYDYNVHSRRSCGLILQTLRSHPNTSM